MNLHVKFYNPGYADCYIEVRAKGFLAASVYWADHNGPLQNWSSLAVFPIDPSGNGKYRFDGKRSIPRNATHIYVKCIAPDFSTVEEAMIEIPEGFLPAQISTNLIAQFTLMSDLHLSGKPGRIVRALQSADNPILIPGDLTNDGYEKQFALFQKCMEETAADKIVLAVTGNHDQLLKPSDCMECTPYDHFQQYLFQRAEHMGVQVCQDPSGAYSAVYSQVDIIGLQCVAPGRKFGLSSGSQLAWLEDHLNNTLASWHIILCHAPLLEHNPHRQNGSAYFSGNNVLQRIVSEHKNIIFTSGHTHYSPNTKQGSVEYDPERQIIYIDDGSVAPTELKGEALMPAEWHDGVVSDLVIYEDAVEITYRAIHTGMKFPRGYYRFQAE